MGTTARGVDRISPEIRGIFEKSQDGELGKCIKRLRKLYTADCTDDKARDHFFTRFVHYLQLPLTVEDKVGKRVLSRLRGSALSE